MAYIVSKDPMLVNEVGQFMYSTNEEEGKLYHHEPNALVNLEGGSAVEEDTEDEDDEETPAAAAAAAAAASDAAATCFKAPLGIQTYSPQLNLSLYSPSVASMPTSRFLSAAAAAADATHAPSPTPVSPFSPSVVQNSTRKKSPLDSFSSNIKMDIRSPPPPQPSQSTSRLMNAFQRLKKTSQRSGNHVVPADIKPCPSKSSLADKIKNKFQAKKKVEIVEKKTTMPRSSSFSSIRHWSQPACKTTDKMVKSSSIHSFPASTMSTSSNESTESSVPTLTLTKSISSHRLYKSTSITDTSRPRQPLRAVNPNDSIRGEKKKNSMVRFTKLVSVKDTFSKMDYDRGSDPEAVCTRLTPTMAQQIKEELNAYKLHEMQVHEYSRVHTHFFL